VIRPPTDEGDVLPKGRRSANPISALLVDYGGVMTSSVQDAISAFCGEIGVSSSDVLKWFIGAYDAGGEALGSTGRLATALQAMELGTITPESFDGVLAKALSELAGRSISAIGLLDGIANRMHPNLPLVNLIKDIHERGVRVVIVSNSWGHDHAVREAARDLDGLVLSRDLGIRKPDPRILSHAASIAGAPQHECLFIDDLPPNVESARAAGMSALLHRDTAATMRAWTTCSSRRSGSLIACAAAATLPWRSCRQLRVAPRPRQLK
jgi:putative hydrolase of the HAD superfamily